MSFEEFRDDFDRDGYVLVRQFLSAAELDELAENLDRYIRDIVPTLPDSDAFYHDKSRPGTLKQMQRLQENDEFFKEYLQHPRWSELASTLLGEPVTAVGPEWFNKPPGTEHPTPPHQDNFYFNLKPPNVATAWLAIDPVDEENGCLRYVVGSHKLGLRPHSLTKVLGFSQGITDYGPEDEAKEVVITMQPGDLAVHHSELIHRADPNRSPTRSRRAFAMVFNGASAKRDEASYARHNQELKKQHESMGLETN